MKAKKVSPFILPFTLSLLMTMTHYVSAQESLSRTQLIKKGEYLAIAADCNACHQSPEGHAMAGGGTIASPLGNIIASNITPSSSAGIGDYTPEQFARALREGINKQGIHLYPAMPYTAYAKLSDDDIQALYFYFMHGVDADDNRVPATHLPFPFNFRAMMSVWNALFADPKKFTPDPTTSAQINRGDYLVNGLAHCDTCHTPRNVLMGPKSHRLLAGGAVGSWYAPNITSDPVAGIGNWSDEALTQYLTTGRAPGKAQAAGPMAEAIEHSLQYLNADDIQAIVAYLRHTPAIRSDTAMPRDQQGTPVNDEARYRAEKMIDAGWQVYASTCANCHQPDGSGNAYYPALYHNTATGAENADNLISVILNGVKRETQGHPVVMPAFGQEGLMTDRLNDQQIADVSNYVLKHFGNAQLHVTVRDVREQRQGGRKPVIAQLSGPLPLTLLLGTIVLIGLAIRYWYKRRPHHE